MLAQCANWGLLKGLKQEVSCSYIHLAQACLAAAQTVAEWTREGELGGQCRVLGLEAALRVDRRSNGQMW